MNQQGTTQQQIDRLDVVPAGSVRCPLSPIGAENMTPVQVAPGGVPPRRVEEGLALEHPAAREPPGPVFFP